MRFLGILLYNSELDDSKAKYQWNWMEGDNLTLNLIKETLINKNQAFTQRFEWKMGFQLGSFQFQANTWICCKIKTK